MVIVSTSAARLTIDAATVPKISMAASGPPLIDCGTSPYSYAWSIAIVPKERATPASTHISGMNQRPLHQRENGSPRFKGASCRFGTRCAQAPTTFVRTIGRCADEFTGIELPCEHDIRLKPTPRSRAAQNNTDSRRMATVNTTPSPTGIAVSAKKSLVAIAATPTQQ